MEVAEILDAMTTRSGEKVLSSDVCVKDRDMINKGYVKRNLENDEFVTTKGWHQQPEKKSH